MPEYLYFSIERATTYSQFGSIWYYWWYASTKERVIAYFRNG